MISASLNDRLTRIGPGTPAGAVLRQYWQPAALIDELAHGPLVPVNLMGERLVLVQGETPHLATRLSSADEAPTHHPAREDIRLAYGRHAMDRARMRLRQVKIAGHAADDGELLPVLLAKECHVGAHLVKEL